MKKQKVLVSGNFDLFHSGHLDFLKQASKFGDLYVGVGTDKNQLLLNGKNPKQNENHRLSIVKKVDFVKDAFLCSGEGILDFVPDLENIKPENLVVNSDGNTLEKEALCKQHGINYIILNNVPKVHLADLKNSKENKSEDLFPFRVCLAGGWMDQPFVNKYAEGSVVVVSIKNQFPLNDRSGMATSSRKTAYQLWNGNIPNNQPPEVLAKLLFGAENPPGCGYVSGAQDQIGLLVPGISKLYFRKDTYWPEISTIADKENANWLESVIELIPLWPRPVGYNPLKEKNLNPENIIKLGQAGEKCFNAIKNMDKTLLGESLMETWQNWKHILPNTVNDEIIEKGFSLNKYGFGFSGSNGGYLIRVKDPDENYSEHALKIEVRLN